MNGTMTKVRKLPTGNSVPVTVATPKRGAKAVLQPGVFAEERLMKNNTYKLIELIGVSEGTVEEAIKNAISRAGKTLKGLDWFEVTETRGLIKNGKVSQYQVKLKVGFRLMSDEDLRMA